MAKCKKCKEWNEHRNYIYKSFTKIGMKVEVEGLDDGCICHLMNNRKEVAGEFELNLSRDLLP